MSLSKIDCEIGSYLSYLSGSWTFISECLWANSDEKSFWLWEIIDKSLVYEFMRDALFEDCAANEPNEGFVDTLFYI